MGSAQSCVTVWPTSSRLIVLQMIFQCLNHRMMDEVSEIPFSVPVDDISLLKQKTRRQQQWQQKQQESSRRKFTW